MNPIISFTKLVQSFILEMKQNYKISSIGAETNEERA